MAFGKLKEFGLDAARIALPKSAELVLGIADPDAVPERFKTERTQNPDPYQIQADVYNTVQRDIKAGVYDKNQIRNDVRAVVKTNINEQFLRGTLPRRKTVAGFKGNAKRNTQEIIDGLGALLGLGIKASLSPIESTEKTGVFAKNLIVSPAYREEIKQKYVNPIIDEYKEYRHPITKAYEDPLDVFLDLTALFSFGASTAGKAGVKISGAAAEGSRLALAGERLASGAGKVETISKPLQIKNLKTATRGVVGKIPGGPEMLRNFGLKSDVRKLLSKEQLSFLNARNAAINEIDKRIGALSKEEVSILPQVAEGFAQPPANASKEFYESLGLMRSLAKDQERVGIEVGKFTEDLLERRKWQPLARYLEKEGKIGDDVLRTTETEFLEARAKFDELASNPNTSTDILRDANQAMNIAKKTFIKTQNEFGFSSMTGPELRAQINTIKKYFPEADPIYMRHFFEDDPKRFTNWFLNTKPVRSFEPGSVKKSYNIDGYIGQTTDVTKDQMKNVLARQSTETIKWKNNLTLLEKLKDHKEVLKLRPNETPLPGYKVFAPDGMIRFYRGTIDLVEELEKKVDLNENVWEAFQDAVNASLDGETLTKEFLGATKATVYQVPASMAEELTKLVRSSNPYMKLFYDKPLDAFRFTALSLFPRWQFNNIVGNAMFSIISGDIFEPKAFYMYRQAKKRGDVFPDELFGGIHATERKTAGRLGPASELPVVRSTVAMHDRLLDTKVVGQFVKATEKTVEKGIYRPLEKVGNFSFKANGAVDEMFKGVSFINKALKEERKGFVKRMVTGVDEAMEIVEKSVDDLAKREALIDHVHNWYYNGLNLTDFERRAVRRAVPFYSWMRWSSLYSYRIATEAPVRANIIGNLAQDFYMLTGQDKLPSWMRGSVPIGNDEDGTVYYLKTSGTNPFSHLNDFMNEGFLGLALQSSAPAPKTVLEQALGQDAFLGRSFTKEGLYEAYSGQLYKFDPELGEVVEVEETVRPGLLENLLRNYIPQYVLMETVLTNGKKRYTAEGLDTILADLFRDEKDRKAVVNDIITKQAQEKTSLTREGLKAVGINIQPVEPEQERARIKAQQEATTAILNKKVPLLNENYKNLLRERVIEEISKGTRGEELSDKINYWLTLNIQELEQAIR